MIAVAEAPVAGPITPPPKADRLQELQATVSASRLILWHHAV